MRTITFHGTTLALGGRPLVPGKIAPDFRLLTQDLTLLRLADLKGKIKLITSFPSLDTPVCDMQVKEFNKAAATLSKQVAVIGVSMDLPFAQKRFCQMNDITGVTVASDHRDASFGINYGVLITDLRLLARAIFIVDTAEIVRYAQIVPELTSPPDFKAALAALEKVVAAPAGEPAAAAQGKCQPCEKGTPSLPAETVARLIARHRGWEVLDDKKLVKEWRFKDFAGAKAFVDALSAVAEEQGHHPSAVLSWGKVRVTLTTHAAGGLTNNDFIMAGLIDELGA